MEIKVNENNLERELNTFKHELQKMVFLKKSNGEALLYPRVS